MNIDRAIHILTEHNKWRRGKPPYDGFPTGTEPQPKEIGEAIDFAVAYMESDLAAQCGICGDYGCDNPRSCETGDGA